jgi:hypothetical protein
MRRAETRIGIVVDADVDITIRWQSLRQTNQSWLYCTADPVSRGDNT